MRTYKETLQLIKKAGEIVTLGGTKGNLNPTEPPETFKPVKETQQASRNAGKAILATTSTASAQKLKKAPAKPSSASFTPIA